MKPNLVDVFDQLKIVQAALSELRVETTAIREALSVTHPSFHEILDGKRTVAQKMHNQVLAEQLRSLNEMIQKLNA